MPRSGKRSIEACHAETEEATDDVTAIKEALEPVKKKGRKSGSNANKITENGESAASVNLSKQRFESEALGFEISIGDEKYAMTPTKFKTGSVG